MWIDVVKKKFKKIVAEHDERLVKFGPIAWFFWKLKYRIVVD